MKGCGNLKELVDHLRSEAEKWRVKEYDAIRQHRDLDAANFRQNAITCANLAAELCTDAMKQESTCGEEHGGE